MPTTIKSNLGTVTIGGFEFSETPINLIDELTDNLTATYEELANSVRDGILIIEGSEMNSYEVICKHIQNKIDSNKSIY